MKKSILFVAIALSTIIGLNSCSIFKKSSKVEPSTQLVLDYYKALKKEDSTSLATIINKDILVTEYSGHPIITSDKTYLNFIAWEWEWDTKTEKEIISSTPDVVVVKETKDNDFIRYIFDKPLTKTLTIGIKNNEIVQIDQDTVAGFKPYITLSTSRGTAFASWVQEKYPADYKYFSFSSRKSAVVLRKYLSEYLKELKSK